MDDAKTGKTVGGGILLLSFYWILSGSYQIYQISSIYLIEALIGFLLFLILTLVIFPLKEEFFDFQKINAIKYIIRLFLWGIVAGTLFLVYHVLLYKLHGFSYTLESVEAYEQSEIVKVFMGVSSSIAGGIMGAFGIRYYQYYK